MSKLPFANRTVDARAWQLATKGDTELIEVSFQNVDPARVRAVKQTFVLSPPKLAYLRRLFSDRAREVSSLTPEEALRWALEDQLDRIRPRPDRRHEDERWEYYLEWMADGAGSDSAKKLELCNRFMIASFGQPKPTAQNEAQWRRVRKAFNRQLDRWRQQDNPLRK